MEYPLRKGTEILRNPDGLAYSSSNLSPIEYHFVARLVAQYLELSTKPLAILFVLLPLHSFDMGDQEVIARNNDHLVRSDDPNHPANLIPELCKRFYQLGWVTGMRLVP